MGLKNANLCTRCGQMRTKHPSGLCCRCRVAPPVSTCKYCGERTTRGRDCCYKCRKLLKISDDLDSAVAVQQKRMMILHLRQSGMSFGEIAEAVGLSKSQVFEAYRDMLRLPSGMTLEIADAMLEHDPEEK